jgi:probable rRNA maturation factor
MILNRQRRVPVDIKPLGNFLGRVLESLRLRESEVTVCLVSDAAMARLNRAFRGKRGPTDVLSFPANGAPPKRRTRRAGKHRAGIAPAFYLGDIAISLETARRNARRFSRDLPEELRVLILHGVLHLAGYDHEIDRGRMERLEGRLRRRLRLH